MSFKNQFRSVIQWETPDVKQLFVKFTDEGDEIKNASKLIISPGQGCLFVYEGKIKGIFEEEGMYDIKTSNIPFLTSLKMAMNLFESEHKVGLWFFRKAELLNLRWGTRMPITYTDPIYNFPVNLRSYGNYSLKINDPESFFINVIAGQEHFYAADLQEIFISRIVQPITNYLANAKFSYAEIDSNVVKIAHTAKEDTNAIFQNMGFKLLDFRIEGTSFDDETNKRIATISDMTAEVKAAKLAGLDYEELQRVKAMRDAANNEGAAGMGMLTGLELGKVTDKTTTSTQNTMGVKAKLKELKELFEDGLITEEEYNTKKASVLDQL